ncbi:MAG: tetratricopeptide repeat protein [Blastochloris sp.]|nr:tetratricopeptide repeat protein [Blastochloris sp.]
MGLVEKKAPYESGEAFAQEVLNLLAQNKISCSKPVSFNFFLYLPNQDLAESCAIQIRSNLGLEVDVDKSAAEDGNMLCWVEGTFIPDPSRLTDIGNLLIQLAQENGGLFDGWDTKRSSLGFFFLFKLVVLSLFKLIFRLPLALFRVLRHCILPGLNLKNGFECLDKKNYDKAESIARKLLEHESYNSMAWQLLGHACLGKKDHEAAIQAFGKSIELDDECEEAYLNLGVALDRAGRPAEAIPHYAKALELRPEYPGCYYNIASAYCSLGDREQCLIYLQYAIYLKRDLLQQAKEDEDFKKILSEEDFIWAASLPAS